MTKDLSSIFSRFGVDMVAIAIRDNHFPSVFVSRNCV